MRQTTARPKSYYRIKTPTVIQMEMAECGAASLAIMLAYHKKYVPLEELRVECGVSRDGSNAFNLIKAANFYGLDAGGYQKDLEELYQLREPVILFWEFKHFLVLEGFGKHNVYVNDPATGPRAISYEEFDRAYTGVILTFKKRAEFKESGAPLNLFKWIYQRFLGIGPPLIFFGITALCLLLLGLTIPAFTRIFIDEIFTSHLFAWKISFLLSMLLAVVLIGVATFLQQFFLNRLQQKLSIQSSSQFLWHILRLPLSFYTQRHSGEIAYRTGLNTMISETLTGTLATTALSLLLIIFYGIVMFTYDIAIAAIGLGGAFLNLGMLICINRSRQDAFSRQQQDYGKQVGVTINALENIETLKATGNETAYFSRWSGYYAKSVNADQEIGKKDVFLNSFRF
jgi:ATP-binding cassette subfamily C protein